MTSIHLILLYKSPFFLRQEVFIKLQDFQRVKYFFTFDALNN